MNKATLKPTSVSDQVLSMENSPEHSKLLGDLAKNWDLKARESNKEVQARLQREAEDAAHQRLKDAEDAAHQRLRDKAILVFVLIIVGLVSLLCISVVVIPGAPPENVKWATTLLTTIVAGGLGYMTGKGAK